MNNISNYLNSSDVSTVIAAYSFLGIVAFAVIFVWLLDIIIKWRIIGKIDGKGWKALIPIYNDYTIWKNVWSAPIFFINFFLGVFATSACGYLTLNAVRNGNGSISSAMLILVIVVAIAAAVIFVINMIYLFKLSSAFGHTGFFVIGLILLPTIFEMILAFSKDEFVGKHTKKKK